MLLQMEPDKIEYEVRNPFFRVLLWSLYFSTVPSERKGFLLPKITLYCQYGNTRSKAAKEDNPRGSE